MLRLRGGAVLALICLLVPARWAAAHALNTSYLTLAVDPDAVRAVIRVHLDDIVRFFPADANGDGRLTAEEISGAVDLLRDFYSEHTMLVFDGRRGQLSDAFESHALAEDASGQEFLDLRYALPRQPRAKVRVRAEWFDRFGQDHTVLMQVSRGAELQQAVLSIGEPEIELALHAPRSQWRQAADFLALGAKHIVLGFDHLLFLAALIIVGGRLRDLVTTVTAFTLAHSLTLILATLDVISPPARLTESLIALSVVYVATENLILSRPGHRWALTFGFGLVHGFGFAGVLREAGLPQRGLISSLLAFNVGVELGQVTVVAALWPLVVRINQHPRRRALVMAGSAAVLACGLGWFIDRTFGLGFMPF